MACMKEDDRATREALRCGCARLGVSIHFVHYWIQQGLIQARQVDDNGPWWITLTDEQEKQLHHLVSTSGHLQNRR